MDDKTLKKKRKRKSEEPEETAEQLTKKPKKEKKDKKEKKERKKRKSGEAEMETNNSEHTASNGHSATPPDQATDAESQGTPRRMRTRSMDLAEDTGSSSKVPSRLYILVRSKPYFLLDVAFLECSKGGYQPNQQRRSSCVRF